MTDEAISIKKEIATLARRSASARRHALRARNDNGKASDFCIYISSRLKLAPLREIWFNAIGGRRWKRRQNP